MNYYELTINSRKSNTLEPTKIVAVADFNIENVPNTQIKNILKNKSLLKKGQDVKISSFEDYNDVLLTYGVESIYELKKSMPVIDIAFTDIDNKDRLSIKHPYPIDIKTKAEAIAYANNQCENCPKFNESKPCSRTQNMKCSNTRQLVLNHFTDKILLVRTNGYSICEIGRYGSASSAQTAMEEDYNRLDRNEKNDDWDELSSIGNGSAILYDRGEDVYVWQMFNI